MKIDMTEVNNQKVTLDNSITSINNELDDSKSSLENLVSTDSLKGMVKSVINDKINNYQVPLLTNFSNALTVLSAQYDKTIEQFQSTVSETASDAIIDTDYLQELIDNYSDLESSISSVDTATSGIYSSISDIISLTNPTASSITDPLSEGKTVLTDTKTNMESFDGWKRGTEYDDLLLAQTKMLETLTTNSTSNFTSPEAKNFYNNIEFSNGVKIITENISGKTPVEVLNSVSETLNALTKIPTGGWWKNFVVQQTGQRAIAAGDIWVDDEGTLHCNGTAEAVAALYELEHGEFEVFGVKFKEGKAFIGTKAAAEIKSTISRDKVELSASAEVMIGMSASASGEMEKEFGVAKLKAEYEAEVKAGAWASANYGITIDGNGFTGKAEASAKAGVEASGSIGLSSSVGDLGFTKVGVNASGEAFAGAKAEASAELKAGPEGVSGSVKLGAFAGAEASGEIKGTVGYFSASAKGSVKAGIGVPSEAKFSMDNEHMKVKLDVGAALGVGAGVGIDVDVDYGAMKKDFNKFIDWVNPFNSKVVV